jgi:radical SAM superfamily enzyme YgiQ (UPF0313 family)
MKKNRAKPSLYLIYPEMRNTFWNLDLSMGLIQKKAAFMPLGMTTAAAVAEKYCSQVELCDARFQPVDYGNPSDIIGFSFYDIQNEQAFEIAERFQKLGKYVIFGGPCPTLHPDECLKHADTIFCGEGEYSFEQFFKDLKRGQPKKVYRQESKTDMKDSPVPAYHLLPMNEYLCAGINFSRGCPYDCEFCDIKEDGYHGKKVRYKEAKQVIEELEALKKYKNLDRVIFHDDNFVGDRKATKNLLRLVAAWQKENGYPFGLNCQCSLNIAQDGHLLELFHEAGFITLYIGIETHQTESLKVAKKFQNISGDMLADIHKIQSYDLNVMAGMITGLDGDKRDVFENMFRFLQKSGIMFSSLGPLNVLDNTPLKRRLIHEGRYHEGVAPYHPMFWGLKKEEQEEDFKIAAINFKPLYMTEEELIEGTNWLIQKLYNHQHFAERYKALLKVQKIKKMKKISHSSFSLSARLIPLFLRALYHIFFSSKKAFYHNLKLVFETLVKKPSEIKSLVRNLGMLAGRISFLKPVVGDPDTVSKRCPVR